jgi:hypothetical protein
MSEPVRYTRELLTQAAVSCSNIDEVIAFLDTRPYASLRRHLFRRFDHFGIDVSHFPRPRRGPASRRPSPDELRRVVAQSSSIAEALRTLGQKPNGGPYAHFHRWVEARIDAPEDGSGSTRQTGR